jgi:hypothetical protein
VTTRRGRPGTAEHHGEEADRADPDHLGHHPDEHERQPYESDEHTEDQTPSFDPRTAGRSALERAGEAWVLGVELLLHLLEDTLLVFGERHGDLRGVHSGVGGAGRDYKEFRICR